MRCIFYLFLIWFTFVANQAGATQVQCQNQQVKPFCEAYQEAYFDFENLRGRVFRYCQLRFKSLRNQCFREKFVSKISNQDIWTLALKIVDAAKIDVLRFLSEVESRNSFSYPWQLQRDKLVNLKVSTFQAPGFRLPNFRPYLNSTNAGQSSTLYLQGSLLLLEQVGGEELFYLEVVEQMLSLFLPHNFVIGGSTGANLLYNQFICAQNNGLLPKVRSADIACFSELHQYINPSQLHLAVEVKLYIAKLLKNDNRSYSASSSLLQLSSQCQEGTIITVYKDWLMLRFLATHPHRSTFKWPHLASLIVPDLFQNTESSQKRLFKQSTLMDVLLWQRKDKPSSVERVEFGTRFEPQYECSE